MPAGKVPVVVLVGAVAAALLVLPACVSLRAPRVGEPVVVRSGESFVVGRIRMVDAADAHLEYTPFWFDPWDQPFFTPGPRMTLELRQMLAPGGAMRYRSHPAPPVDRDGSFAWLLPAGEYVMAGNPRLVGSERFTPNETSTLATFTAPASSGTIYLGTLVLSVEFDFQDLIRAQRRGEAEYATVGSQVVDERESTLARLRERFPALPEPIVTTLMRQP